MDFAEQLRILQAAQGSAALLALATVDLVHHALPAIERTRIKDALVAAAVPHWCDHDFLAALLETTPEESERRLGQLRMLTVVEPFPARGAGAVNVHEAARLAVREHLRETDAARWQALAIRARAHVGQSTEAHARIEALYHLFAIDQPAAAAECEDLDRNIISGARPEMRYALALALEELTAAEWLTGLAQVEALLTPLEVRSWRGETAQLEGEARRVADLARAASHPSRLGRAQGLLGDVLQGQGQLDAALEAFHECLAIFQRLASTDASNSDWQRDLAVAHSRIGDVAQAQGRLDDALVAFREYLAIFQRLAATDPSNADWRRELAVAHSKVGDIAEAQGRLDDALASYREYLVIFQRFAATDPLNARWQRDLAVARSRIGDIAQAQGRLDDALAGAREDLAIFLRLAATDPSNAGWQRDLAVAHHRVGQALHRIGHEEDAQSSFRSAVAVMERAVAMSSGNVRWREGLANLKSWLAAEGGA